MQTLLSPELLSIVRGLRPFGLAALVWDRASAHREQGVRAMGLPLMGIPPASPEQDPAERVFEDPRRAVECNAYATLADKVAAVRAELARLEADPDRVGKLTGWGWIAAAIQQLPLVHAA